MDMSNTRKRRWRGLGPPPDRAAIVAEWRGGGSVVAGGLRPGLGKGQGGNLVALEFHHLAHPFFFYFIDADDGVPGTVGPGHIGELALEALFTRVDDDLAALAKDEPLHLDEELGRAR